MPKTRLLWLLAGLIALKFALLLIDGKPAVFMGDSGSYLYTALHGYIPPDRSFAYGYLLFPLAVWPHSLLVLLSVQTALSAVSAWLIAFNLIAFFAVSFRRAALLSTFCAVEPLQLLSERYVLTDTLALFLFAVLVTITLAYWRKPGQIKLALALITGLLLISIRMSYLPLVLLDSLILPLLLFRTASFRVAAALALLWVGAGQLLLFGYRSLNASVSGMAEPEFLYSDGFFLLSNFAPIIRSSDFPSGMRGNEILASVKLPLDDPMSREAQLFYPNGIDAAISRAVPDTYRANQVARRIALHAAATHPVSLVWLGMQTWGEFFEIPQLRRFLIYDEGGLRPGDRAFGEEIRGIFGTEFAARDTDSAGMIARWHRAAIPWYLLLVLAPVGIPIIMGWRRRNMNAPAMLIGSSLILLFGQAVLLAPHAEPRYLMPVAWLTFLAFGFLVRPLSQTTAAPATLPAPED